jgi:hypothetical protein
MTQTEPALLDRSDDDLDAPLWGAGEIGKHIRRNQRQVFYLLESGRIDATKVGQLWTTTRRRLNKSLGNA